MLLWHATAIALTAVFVLSGFDGWYFATTNSTLLFSIAIPSAIVGGLVPILTPLILWTVGWVWKKPRVVTTGWAVATSALLGLLLSFLYKTFTGRVPPVGAGAADMSQMFRFGFLRGGVFWGWPSSHTTVAFAVATTIFLLFPRSKFLRILSVVFALYVGLGVSVTIHWFSDFVAGAIFGTIVGLSVIQVYSTKSPTTKHH